MTFPSVCTRHQYLESGTCLCVCGDYGATPTIRALTPEMLAWCAGSGRFFFHKDTSVDTQVMLSKIAAIKTLPQTNLKLASFFIDST